MTIAVVAEKPSVARDIARVLGATKRGNGFIHGNGYAITWAVGHLVTLAQPHEIHPEWKRWRRDTLPMVPESWPLEVLERTHDQFQIVRRMLRSDKVTEVVCATDAGREGELIFRYIYEAAGSTKPVRRLWISSLTADAIRQGFARLRPGSDFEPLADAARGRSRADWLVGMNLSRACTLAYGGHDEMLSVGRVQTPTLAMVVQRELEIRDFVPEEYLEVWATFQPEAPEPGAAYRGVFFKGKKPTAEARRLPKEGEEARQVVARALEGEAAIESVKAERKRMPPPFLYDLTELQRHANRLWGWTAKRTLGVAQKLYEQRKLLSYPRTDSRHLTKDVAKTLPGIVRTIEGPYAELVAEGTGTRPLGRRFVDDSKVSDHHAIIPTNVSAENLSLDTDEERLYDLVCRRLLMAWHDDHEYLVTTVTTAIRPQPPAPSPKGRGGEIVDRYHSRGTMVEKAGWKVLDLGGGKKGPAKGKGKAKDDDQDLPPGLVNDQPQEVLDAKAEEKKTRPPKRFTEATLLTAMETAGKALDDKELSAAMKESGLGTPATRADTIETLLRREYVLRRGKAFEATDRGIRLISLVHPHVKSPAMTGEWEAKLKRIEKRGGDLGTFMEGIEAYVREVVGEIFSGRGPGPEPGGRPMVAWGESANPRTDAPGTIAKLGPPGGPMGPGGHRDTTSWGPVNREPVPPDGLGELLRTTFGFEDFRPYQEPVCRAVTEGKDALLVMPTGAGKSLCYQLPGLARAGTTLVISPLIALMEDQVAKLQQAGLRAERIHSGRHRMDSRRVSADYLHGRLDFLFIAPERLSVSGFPEMLAKRIPAVIAVDEAHCISHWGHDFRPDYRLLGERLPLLRPAPVIGLTATATPIVQDDIVSQLGLIDGQRFIHGFRRTNIAVEVSELRPSQRRDAVRRVLADPARRPAIVYAPSRKEADALGDELSEDVAAAAYHAGMIASRRDQVQAAFLDGRIEVIVATIAFGMGVDKADVRTVIHTGLPGSVEGYYQEIGRAGRDGELARAVLLYSWADRKTHEFFHERDYPDVAVLERIAEVLTEEWQPKGMVYAKVGGSNDVEELDKALEKLWIHHGAEIDPEENVRLGGIQGGKDRPARDWRVAYQMQSRHKLDQLEGIMRFATSHGCRMIHLVRHFGDREDSGQPCGLCDICLPQSCVARRFSAATPEEQAAAVRIADALKHWNGQGTGKLYQNSCPGGALDRNAFERVLAGLARVGLVRMGEDSFDKDGRTIHFQRAYLTPDGFQTDVASVELELAEAPPKKTTRRKAPARKKKAAKKKATTPRTKTAAKTRAGASDRAKAAEPDTVPLGGPRGEDTVRAPASDFEVERVLDALKAWRLKEAKRRRIPAFRIMNDRTLRALAEARPRDEETLLQVRGIGPTLARKYGAKLIEIVAKPS